MKNRLRAVVTIALAGQLVGIAWPSELGASTQQQPQDSTAVLLRRLQQRLDSLERVVAQLRASARDTAEVMDDLAALRAAANAAAADAAQSAPPPSQDQGSRTRSLTALNPEISVTGDIVGSFVAPGGSGERAFSGSPREFEFSFQAALDPYTRTKVFVAREEHFEIAGVPEEEGEEEEGGGFEIEEGYMYWVGLPGGFGLKVGKFRQDIGLYNRWHTHALLETDRPLATSTFLSEHGLIQTGAAVALPSFTIGPATQHITFEITRGDNEALFDHGHELSYLGRFQNFWDLGGNAFFQLGVTGVAGENDEVLVESRLIGVDFFLRWTPAGRSLYRDFQLKSEWYFARRQEVDDVAHGNGGYAQASYRLGRQWILGIRADYVDPYADETNILQLVPTLTWWQSEWVRIRLQYNLLRPEGGVSNHTALLQFVWAMGPHKHETY